MKRSFAILTALVLLSSSACSLRKKPTGEDFYAQGQLNYDNHEYKAAVENYQKLIDQYPFSPFEEDAELKIGLAYYQQQEYAEAVASLDDFQRMHPTSKKLDLVTYYIAMSYFDQIGREDQDQSKTQSALKRFEEIEERFPESSFDELAREHVTTCREMLARHDMVVGNYYYKRANFRAAESRFAELMQQYPDTPVAPDALWELGIALEKEGKKYSAAQAFAALEMHYPHTPYGPKARVEMRKLHQVIDTEEDPLPMVLAETGYPTTGQTEPGDNVVVRQRDGSSSRGGSTLYGDDGLPILASADKKSGNTASDAEGFAGQGPSGGGSSGASGGGNGGGLTIDASPPPSGGVASGLAASAAPASPPSAGGVANAIASAGVPSFGGAGAQAAPPPSAPSAGADMLAAPSTGKGSTGFAGGDMMAMNVPSGGSTGGGSPLPTQVAPEQPPAPAPPMQEVSSLGSDSSAPADSSGTGGSDHASGGLQPAIPIASEPVQGANTTLPTAPAPEPGPAMLKTIRLSSNDPPLTVIFDLTGPVRYEKSMESTNNGAVVTLVLRDVKPGTGIAKHVVFDRSIFKDCDISRDSDKTTITLNMQPITSYSVVPLDDPARLLVTFTPQNPPDLQKTSANN